jgi:hypothetical protein
VNLNIDGTKFDELQGILIGGIIEEIKSELESASLPPTQVRDLLEKISFSVAAILDGSRSVEFEGVEANPVVTFSVEGNLVSGGGNSWMHEYVFGTIAEIYGE